MHSDNLKVRGQNCHLVPTSDGRILVQSRNTGPMMMKGIYSGRGPFTVVKTSERPDVVVVKRIGESFEVTNKPTYWEIIAPSTAAFTQDPLIVDVDPSDLPMDIDFSTSFSVFFVDWADVPPFFPTSNPLYQLTSVQPHYVIERWRDAVYAESVGSGTIVPVLDAYVDVAWTGTINIPPDAADPTGTYPNDSFKIRLYTDNSLATEMLVIASA